MKDSPRIYVPQSEKRFSQGLEVQLSPSHAHYLGAVMRLNVGNEVRIFNAQSGEWTSHITELRRNHCRLHLLSCLRQGLTPEEARPSRVLAFALLKRDATDTVIRMGTELGVKLFVPIITERTNAHRVNLSRLNVIAIEAAEQCERLDIPDIAPITTLTSFLKTWSKDAPIFVGLERSNAPFPTRVSSSFAFLVGPEGGFSNKEVSELKKSEHVCAVSLGKTVLRADTAALAGLSALSILAQSV